MLVEPEVQVATADTVVPWVRVERMVDTLRAIPVAAAAVTMVAAEVLKTDMEEAALRMWAVLRRDRPRLV